MPDSGVWRQSVGWLTAVLVASWLARVLWALWNRTAMEDAERGLYRTQEPLGVLLALFVELLLTAVAVVTFNGWTFTLAGLGVLVPLIAVAVAQGRCRAPKGLQTATPEPSTSSAIVAGRALMALGFLSMVIVGVPVVLPRRGAERATLCGAALRYRLELGRGRHFPARRRRHVSRHHQEHTKNLQRT